MGINFQRTCHTLILAAAPLLSDTCRVVSNITQYLNHFFSTIVSLERTPECTFSTSCNDISCALPSGGYYNLSILACQTPPAVRLVTSGELSFDRTISRSEVVPFSPAPGVDLNVTVQVIDYFTIGLAVSQNCKITFFGTLIKWVHFFQIDFINESANNKSVVVIPYIEILPNKSTCTSNDYSHSPLVTTCEVLPLLSQSGLESLKPTTTLLSPCSVKQNCTASICQVSSLGNATIEVRLRSCFQPPSIDVTVYDSSGNAAVDSRIISTSERIGGIVDGRYLGLGITVVERASRELIGVQVSCV